MTPVLFHGPEARDLAVRMSEDLGRPVREPLGDAGLKVAEAREVVVLARLTGVGSKPPSLVVGPLDRATPEAADALLKTLEDLTEAPIRLILWAEHLQGVILTIQSRTRAVWAPPGPGYLSPVRYMSKPAHALCDALLAGDSPQILDILMEAGKDWTDLLEALCEPLSENMDRKEALEVWESVRKVLDGKGSVLTAADALLPGGV